MFHASKKILVQLRESPEYFIWSFCTFSCRSNITWWRNSRLADPVYFNMQGTHTNNFMKETVAVLMGCTSIPVPLVRCTSSPLAATCMTRSTCSRRSRCIGHQAQGSTCTKCLRVASCCTQTQGPTAQQHAT